MFPQILIASLAALLTVGIELLVLFFYKVRDLRFWLSIPINIGTNLLLNCVVSLIYGYSPANIKIAAYIIAVIVGEICVFFIEWGFYALIKKDKKNYQYSLVANLCSAIIGSAILLPISLLIL